MVGLPLGWVQPTEGYSQAFGVLRPTMVLSVRIHSQKWSSELSVFLKSLGPSATRACCNALTGSEEALDQTSRSAQRRLLLTSYLHRSRGNKSREARNEQESSHQTVSDFVTTEPFGSPLLSVARVLCFPKGWLAIQPAGPALGVGDCLVECGGEFVSRDVEASGLISGVYCFGSVDEITEKTRIAGGGKGEIGRVFVGVNAVIYIHGMVHPACEWSGFVNRAAFVFQKSTPAISCSTLHRIQLFKHLCVCGKRLLYGGVFGNVARGLEMIHDEKYFMRTCIHRDVTAKIALVPTSYFHPGHLRLVFYRLVEFVKDLGEGAI